MTSRRTVLKAGLLGGALLAVAGTAALLAGRDATRDRESVLRALIPVFLAGALPAEPAQREAAITRTLAASQEALAALSAETQRELAQLFALLSIAPLRWLTSGVSVDLPRAPVDELAAFLQGWRMHRLALLQGAYHGLHQLIVGPWYAQAASWDAIGYAGPLRL